MQERRTGCALSGTHKAFFNAEDGPAYREKYLCPITGNAASIFFAIRPQNWHDLALLVGEENIPKILKGWRRRGHNGVGNPLLSVTDPVTFVGTPFEETGARAKPLILVV